MEADGKPSKPEGKQTSNNLSLMLMQVPTLVTRNSEINSMQGNFDITS